MEKLLFTLALVLTAGLISLLTGRNRRQFQKVPEGMGILCPPPGKRYMLYALGVLVMAVVLFFNVLYIMDGAPESARLMWGLCIAAAVLNFVVCIAGGSIMARECVYFDGEKIQVNHTFRKNQIYQWNEISIIKGSFDKEISLYLFDGTRVLTAGIGLMNYEIFRAVLKSKCPAAVAEYYRLQDEHPQKCVLRYGAEYYLLAVMGILMLLVYLALLGSSVGDAFWERLLHSEPSEWFAFWFGPVSGVIGMIALFVFCNTKVKYSPEELVIKYPLRRTKEIPWRQIQQIEVVREKKEGKKFWKKLRLYTKDGVYKINLGLLTWGKDGFMTQLYNMIERYEIFCSESEK